MRFIAKWMPIVLLVSACGEAAPNTAGSTVQQDGFADGVSGVDAGGDIATANSFDGSDGKGTADASTEGGATSDALTDGSAGSDANVDSAADSADIDFDLLDPLDTADATVDSPAQLDPSLAAVFAHSSSQLYRLDLNTFSLVGTFQFNKNSGEVTDIALDDNGFLYAVTFDDLFKCDKANAKCQWLAGLPQSFNGLTFVPKDVAVPGQAALIGVANSGDWNLITVTGSTATIKKLGSYGGFTSSGDAFSVEGIGTYATVKSGFGGTDKLVQVNPANGSVLKTVGDTGVSDLWGIAWSAQVLYGFSASGAVYSLNVLTGKAASIPGLQVPKVAWWGAGVSTRATRK